MKRIALKTYGKILAFILSFFGLSSCDFYPRVEYGTPSADYIVKGKVTDAQTNVPVKGIGIIVPNKLCDTVYTNEQGDYKVELNTFPYWNEKMKVIAKDLDGSANGSFESDSLEIEFTSKDQTKKASGNWYSGTFEKTNQNFKLKQQDMPIPMYGVMQAPFKESEHKDDNK